MGRTWEVWIIDDGSTDDTFAVVEELAAARPQVHGLSFGRNFGKAAALAAGFEAASADIVITMDADLQDDPAEIPALVASSRRAGTWSRAGSRTARTASSRTTPARSSTGSPAGCAACKLHDFNCGLKAYRREVTQRVKLYGEMHRYVPALAHLDGFRVTELPVRHSPASTARPSTAWPASSTASSTC